MLEMKECCQVPFPEKLFEGYEVQENRILANVNASKAIDMMREFIAMHDEPLFFILELPSKNDDGITESKVISNEPNDIDVYFIDKMDAKQANDVLNAIGKFLVRDGQNTFGIGGHFSKEEILFERYSVMVIYAKDCEKYSSFFSKFDIERVENLVTAWETFDRENPGECRLLVSEKSGKTIYDIPETYKDYGMYFYEKRSFAEEEYDREVTHEELIGKVLLVGVTYYTADNEFIEQKQFYGTVTEANDKIVRMVQKDGSEFTLPPDLSSTKRARPGEYKLRSTKEVVVDPDFIATWNVTKGE